MTPRSPSAVVCTLLVLVGLAIGALVLARAPFASPPERPPALELRVGVEQLRNPFWYEAKGHADEVREFWDRDHWERVLKGWADDGYNALLYWVEPWTET